ncbi:MAG: DUF86 domain-containing protein [Firmicutes bacterium]|nr:DUF86 domain-containing protein [Bacillota bacterium]MCL5038488.1 DUF86 domain-containing protein [Bacillota bacterium]
MYNRALIDERISIISSSIKRLSLLAQLPREKFCRDEDAIDIAENRLRRALEAVFDLGRHLVVKAGWGIPHDYRSVIDLLAQSKVLPADFAQRIVGMAGYRNRLIHDYNKITPEELYEIVQTRLTDFESFQRYVVEFLEQP